MRFFVRRQVRWRLRAEITLWRHGWVWLLVAGAATAAGAVMAVWWPAAAAARDEAREALARARSNAAGATAAARPASAALAPTAEVPARHGAVRATLRAAPEPLALVRRMNELAQAEQVVLTQADYQPQAAAGDGLPGVERLQVTQPLRASYPQLRRYALAVLREVPGASLDQVSFRRENVGQGQVEARLKWSLWRERPASDARPSEPAQGDATATLERRDLFASRSWAPPPAPPPPPPPAPPPTAPPLPYAYLGKKLEGGQWEVYLMQGEDAIVARAGETLAGQWRVEPVAPPLLSFTYLPLNQVRTLAIGDAR